MTRIVDTKYGKVEGSEDGGVVVFRGIPFAAPPIGSLRFRAPQPPSPWTEVRDCSQFGAISAQSDSFLDRVMGDADVERSEDSLTLNVWTPGLDGRRPVMVWIHGGGFLNGSGRARWYDGTRFVRNGDVVLVTLNYRLTAFGFLHLEDHFGADFAGSGNNGILDQIAALEWVRDHANEFGGDPNRITIFGESAGAGSVGTLLGTPRAKGLFQRAILQSGAAHWCSERDRAAEVTDKVLAALGIAHGDARALLQASTDAVVEAAGAAGSETNVLGLPFEPVLDGTVLPESPLDAITAGSAAGLEIVVGTNLDEMTLFGIVDPALANIDHASLVRRARAWYGSDGADSFVTAYEANRPGATAQDIWVALASDAVFRLPAIRLAERQVAHGAVYSYLFTWPTPVFGGSLKCAHALDIPFVFDNLDQYGVELFTGLDEERAGIARRWNAAWTAFAHDGIPAGDGVPEWPRYDTQRRATMQIDAQWQVVDDPESGERRLWDGHLETGHLY